MSRSTELRQIPISHTSSNGGIGYDPDLDAGAIRNMYLNDTGSWIYGATNQLTLNSSGPSWSIDEWSFVPLDLTQIPKLQSAHNTSKSLSSTSSYQNVQVPSVNVTVSTPAIRTRLECEAIAQVSQASSWISKRNISHSHPSLIASSQPLVAYRPLPVIFNNTAYETSTLSYPVITICCTNESGESRRSALGYWSTTNTTQYPHKNATWPITFLSKWMLGDSFLVPENFSEEDEDARDSQGLYFTEEPLFQAVQCNPVIETAEAEVTVDANSGRVLQYQILNNPEPLESPWLDVFVYHANYTDCEELLGCNDGPDLVFPNITNR